MFNNLIRFLSVIVVFSTVCRGNKLLKKENLSKRVCIIGAGVSGLSTARYLKEEGINFTVLEATRYVGGTWRYDPRVQTDENGQPLHTSMYKYLRTNLPKPTMELPGFPLPADTPSFLGWEMYYNYLNDYANHFDIKKHIQFLHNVVLVTRKNNVWKVRHEHVQTHEVFEEEYDYVVVANGQFTKPKMPNIPGENTFRGSIIHSHDYRQPKLYTGRRVLIVGGGPSAFDIALEVVEVSSSLIHSHHLPVNFRTKFPANYVRKQDVKELNGTGAVFVDGSFMEIDDIIYCTGFEYDFPFLDETSELTLTPRNVLPLYKHIVNINQPTMLLMGLVERACLVIARDAQARYIAALVTGNFTLPSHGQMMKDWQKQADAVKSRKLPLSFIHMLDRKENQYYAELSEESGIYRVPPVMFKIRAHDTRAIVENLYTYRNYVYTVIDDNTYTWTYEAPPTRNNSLSPFVNQRKSSKKTIGILNPVLVAH